MKISSVSKKVLASALSAAMVVAFTPAVSMAKVIENGGGSTAEEALPEVTGDTVATVSYIKNSTKYTELFQASDAASYDNAVQAAVIFANEVATNLNGHDVTGATKITVQLQKDVEVDAAYGLKFKAGTGTVAAGDPFAADYYEKIGSTYKLKFAKGATNTTGNTVDLTAYYVGDEDQKLIWAPEQSVNGSDIETASGIVLGGNITFDLNGHTISNTANKAADTKGVVTGEDGVFIMADAQVDFAQGYRTAKAGSGKVTVYATSKTVAIGAGYKDKAGTEVPGTAQDAKVISTKTYIYNDLIEAYLEATDAQIADPSKIPGSDHNYYYQFEVSYKADATYGTGSVAAATTGTVITDTAESKGAIVSTNATAITGDGSVALKDIAISAKTAEGVKADIDGVNVGGDVDITGATSINLVAKIATNAETDADDNSSAAALYADNVRVYKIEGTGANAVNGSLTASADVSELGSYADAAAIWAKTKYTADKGAVVDATAKANGRGSANGETGSIIGTGSSGTGQIKPDSSGSAGAAKEVHSYAVSAPTVDIKAGKYSGEYAVGYGSNVNVTDSTDASFDTTAKTAGDGATGSIKYGEFTGHVFGEMLANEDAKATTNLDVTGGIFSENPVNTLVESKLYTDGKAATKATKTYMGNKVDTDHAVATDGSKFYVYKAANTSTATWFDTAKVMDNLGAAVDPTKNTAYIAVDDIAKPAEGKAVANWAVNTVASLAMGKAVAGVELGADAAAVQAALIDGNVDLKDGKVSLQVTPKRIDPKSSKLTDAEKQLLADFDKVADSKTQSVQGVYTLSAQLNQGIDAKTGKAIKIADVKDMGDTTVAITVRPVSMNSEAQVAYLDGKTAAVKMTQAVTNNQAGDATVETSNLESFSVLYSSTGDIIKRQDKAAAKVVSDEIAKLGADYATVTSANYKAAAAAAAEAEKDYSKLTAAQQQYVTAEELAVIDKVKADAASVAKVVAAEKASLKKVKNVTIKAKANKTTTGKLAKVSGVTYKKITSNSKVKVYKAGKIVVKKGLKAGKNYTVKVKATCGSSSKTVKVLVKVAK